MGLVEAREIELKFDIFNHAQTNHMQVGISIINRLPTVTYPLSLLFLFFLVAVIVALLNSISLSFYFSRGFASSSANPTASAGKE